MPLTPEELESLQARLEVYAQQRRNAEALATTMPDALAAVVLRFDTPGLFKGARIDYVDPNGAGCLELAWPAKRMGIRLTRSPQTGDFPAAPDVVRTDAASMEQGWLFFTVDPESPMSAGQFDRALRVIKRMGAYPR